MKTLSRTMMAAGLAVAAAGVNAQSIGAACGCPPVGSRTTVTLDPTNAPTVVAVNGDMIPASYTMTCNNLYILNDKFYVPDGKDLYIEPGTVIKAPNIGGGNAAALIVSRGGQLWANGSESCPIIFTAQADPLDGSYAVTNRGKWGGIIILGRAYNNIRTTDVGSVSAVTGINGVGLIEGLTNETRNYYGAPVGSEVNNDNSGVLRYVSIRHGGELLGANNEINGLTLGSVGTGTTIEHIEVVGNLDDGIEFFGGTVNAKNLVVMHCDDDYIDWDQAYDGRIQFVYALQGPDNRGGALNQGDNGLELDRDDHPTNATNGGLSGAPQIWNATIFARTDNVNADPANLNPAPADEAIEAKERATGSVNNSIFVNFRSGLNLIGAVGAANTTDNWLAGTFNAKNNTFISCTNPLRINGANVTSGANFDKFTLTDGNVVLASGLVDATFDINPMLTSNTVTDRVNPVPAAGTATTTLKPSLTETFLTGVQYRGAFEPGAAPWTQNWTLAADIGSDLSAVAGCVGDLNKDGVINSSDFTLFVNAFGGSCF
jgi:hypothetical protein